MNKCWKDLAASEMRLHLMTELGKINVGFAEVEEFNLGLNCKFRSKAFKNNSEMNEGKIIRVAMEIKMRDERKFNGETETERNAFRRELGDLLGEKFKKIQNGDKGSKE